MQKDDQQLNWPDAVVIIAIIIFFLAIYLGPMILITMSGQPNVQ